MNKSLDKIRQMGIIPVVKIEDENDAVQLMKALKEGGLDSIEITFRSSFAKGSIKKIREKFPDVLIGAGTVITVDQVKDAVDAGASFIISPGYIEAVVDFCVGNNILVIPGCSNASEVAKAINKGLEAVKFFPAEASGGTKILKAFSGPYPGIKFIPTGGINEENLKEYLDLKNVIACGGTWMVKDKLIKDHKFDEIRELTKKAIEKMLDYKVAHVGINSGDSSEAKDICSSLEKLFYFGKNENENSIFSETAIEVMKSPFYGKNGHLAVAVNYVDRAIYQLEKAKVKFIGESLKYNSDNEPAVIYLKEEIGGFAVHLVKRG